MESGGPDELVLILDVAEVSRLLERKVSRSALAAGLPGQAGKLADAVMEMVAEPKTPEPRSITSITVKVTETRVIASETLMLTDPRQVFT